MKINKPPRVLVAPLNWGLGHATRCIPIIQALQRQGAEVLIGSDGEALKLLQIEFPELNYIELPAYNIHYKHSNMLVNMAPQLPKLLRVLNVERRFLAGIIQSHKIDALISDNRYGLSTKEIPSVFITHQLNIRIPNILLQKGVNLMNHRLINRFEECWVPDFWEEPSLSGELGHHSKISDIRYLGPLSRLEQPILEGRQKPYNIVALLSGPEPQRTYLEEKLLQQLSRLPLRCLLVRGKPKSEEGVSKQFEQVDISPYLTSKEVAFQLSSAGMLVARSGYSTIMDMAKIGCRSALLIPTPGQTEQEYLASRLAQKGQALVQEQKHLDVAAAWEQRAKVTGFQHPFNSELLEKSVTDLLNRVKK